MPIALKCIKKRRFFRSPSFWANGRIRPMQEPQSQPNALAGIPRKLPDPLCRNCAVVFAPKRSWQKFCSVKCRNDYYWKTHKIVKIRVKAA